MPKRITVSPGEPRDTGSGFMIHSINVAIGKILEAPQDKLTYMWKIHGVWENNLELVDFPHLSELTQGISVYFNQQKGRI